MTKDETNPLVGEAADGIEAAQYSEAKDDKKLSENQYMGKVQLVQDNESGAHMQVLQWSFTNDDILRMFKDGTLKVDPKTGLNTNELTVFVKFEGVKNVWVPFVIPAGKIHFATASINNNKTLSYWFKRTTTAHSFGTSSLHSMATPLVVASTMLLSSRSLLSRLSLSSSSPLRQLLNPLRTLSSTLMVRVSGRLRVTAVLSTHCRLLPTRRALRPLLRMVRLSRLPQS